MSAEGGAEQLEQPSTTYHVEVLQPQVAVSADGEAHQLLGPEPVESAVVEDGQSMGAIPKSFVPTPLVPSAPTTSAQPAEEEEAIPVARPSTKLQAYGPEFVELMRSWSRLLNQASIFDGQLRVSITLCHFLLLAFSEFLFWKQSYAQDVELKASIKVQQV